jgi:tRNA-specific 2-thiouridylase
VRLPEFLQQKLLPKQGNIIQIDKGHEIFSRNDAKVDLETLSTKKHFTPEMGKIVGLHQGAHYFTVGQRKGLNVGGTTEPLFIIGTDVVSNTIYVGLGANHRGLFRKGLFVQNQEAHWIRQDLKLEIGQSMQTMARIRYRQPLQKATIFQEVNRLYIIFDEPQSAITEGQFVAWHIDNEVIGSGVIS